VRCIQQVNATLPDINLPSEGGVYEAREARPRETVWVESKFLKLRARKSKPR
jgi:hypothetical protein